MNHRHFTLPTLISAVLLASPTPARSGASLSVTADFAVAADYPLSKDTFGVFNSGLVPVERYERDIHLYDEVRPESLRIDLWWGGGGWLRQPVSGVPDAVRYDFAEMDRLASLLNTHDVLPYWAYCYVPEPLQNPRGDAKTNFQNYRLWGEILATFANHARTGHPNLRIGYHEIYNEPDNHPEFFKGRLEDYLEMYLAGATAIRRADPDALIGGPSLAFNDQWVPPFLKFVEAQDLPLDFFSFHYYPSTWEGFYPRIAPPPEGSKSIKAVLDSLRQDLARHPRFATTESHLNEFNSYRIDYPRGGRQDHYPLASAMLHDFRFFLSRPDLTRVHWAQFMDSGHGNYSGMISIDGHRKALFNAYALYARMPVDRRELNFRGSQELEGFASSDPHQACVLMWNRTSKTQTLQIDLQNAPFAQGFLRVYRIDADHASWGDNPDQERLLPVESRESAATANLSWSGSIPPDGVLYLELNDGSGRSELEANAVTRVLRVLHYHPNRFSTAYADFDRNTWIARLGMASEERAEARIGAVVENLPAALSVRVQTDGRLRKLDVNSLLGLRIDYQARNGTYTRSVLFHGPCSPHPDLYATNRNTPVPWGTRRQADQHVSVPDLAQFNLRPAQHAPDDWTGRAQVSFIQQNTGAGTGAKFSIANAADSDLPTLRSLFDAPVRDTFICLAPDGTYYLTGTTGHPTWWRTNDGIRIWRSTDLVEWEPLGLVWSFDRDATWQKAFKESYRAVWAPELHYLKGTFWIAYCMNWPGGGTGLLKSTSGKAKGPYVDANPHGPMTQEIDASLFQDDDGTVYFVYQDGKIARLKDDLSGLAEEPTLLKPANYKHVGFEGAFISKINGRYFLICAESNPHTEGDTYDCMVASSDHLLGPYGDRYLAVPHGGHNMLFQDNRGQRWSTFFGSDARAPWRERPGILPVHLDAEGRIAY